MDIDTLRHYLDDDAQAAGWLRRLGVADVRRGHDNLVRMATRGMTLDLLASLLGQLPAILPSLSDPDMALNNLERYVRAVRSPLALGALFERDPEALPTLLQILSTSQYLSDLLEADPESFDLVRLTEGQPVARDDLVAEVVAEVSVLADESAVMDVLRRYKQRENLRIAFGDIVRGQTLATVSRQISYLADAILEGAVRFARRWLEEKRGVPRGPDGRAARFVVLGLGKLGGVELNYSSDIDLICLYDVDGETDGAHRTSNQEFFSRLVRECIRLLTEPTKLGTVYRVDLRLRPEGGQSPAACSVAHALRYYDVKGRTWERQAYVKARPVAGDLDLGRDFLAWMEPWIYRRYLSLVDITGIKSLKRRIEKQARQGGGAARNVKTGHGGIRDVEFVIQFLQLLNGGALAELRTGNTLDAIARLEKARCLTFQERGLLAENYAFLRKLEHRLQIMFDLQTHHIPEDPRERGKVAVRMGFVGTPHRSALEAFDETYKSKTELNRKILDHLLHDAFGDDAETEPEVDLVNDPDPPRERIEEVLSRYPFADVHAAYQNLMALATERIRFLSTRRCRHFLASIAPRLLRAIATTPDPHSTLVNLSQVSDSLGGKGALWELLSANDPSLHLVVTLCAACPYLAGILTSNPGMIDELMDSLLRDGLPTRAALEQSLAGLCRGAEEIAPILHSFKNVQHLRVGVRDILGKDDVQETHAALSAIAETCLQEIATRQYAQLLDKFGQPTIGKGPDRGQAADLAVLALGKLGGREPNYHSDLDLVFLFDGDGSTVPPGPGRHVQKTSNSHFFSELGQRIIKVASHLGTYGRLYEVDARLRPTGGSGTLAVSVEEFRRYFDGGRGQLWERQALCKGRVIFGGEAVTRRAEKAVAHAAYGFAWQAAAAAEIRRMRRRLEETASPRNLKRGRGGTVDVEFLVQMLQLRHGGGTPSVRQPGTLDAIAALHEAGILDAEDYRHLRHGYSFLRSVEARIRLMNAADRHDLPADEVELGKLAYLLGYRDAGKLVAETAQVRRENRRRFDRIFAAAAQG